MKLIMRADDLGFSEGINYGIRKVVEEKCITCVGLMTNMDYAAQGYNMVEKYDISLGLHTNISLGTPISNPKLISSLINEDGEFYRSGVINHRVKDTIEICECELEVEAQLNKFIEITGKKPDYIEGHAINSKNFFQSLKNVATKYDIFYSDPMDKDWQKKYNVYVPKMFQLNENGVYDPQTYLESIEQDLLVHDTSILVFHPGFLDQYVIDNSSFTLIRIKELEFLCSSFLREWKRENNVEYIKFSEL